MTFMLEIIKVGKFSTSWSLTKLLDFGTHAYIALVAWIDFNSRTFEIRPSEHRENLHFLFSFFLPLLPCFFLLSSVRFSSSFSFWLFFPLIHRTPSLLFAPILFSFSFSIFSFLSFSPLFHFLFSHPFLLLLPVLIKKWGKLPPTFLLIHLSSPQIFLIFLIFFLFLLFPYFDT